VGRELSLTRERIRQIERGALDKLRARSERVQLRSYLESYGVHDAPVQFVHVAVAVNEMTHTMASSRRCSRPALRYLWCDARRKGRCGPDEHEAKKPWRMGHLKSCARGPSACNFEVTSSRNRVIKRVYV